MKPTHPPHAKHRRCRATGLDAREPLRYRADARLGYRAHELLRNRAACLLVRDLRARLKRRACRCALVPVTGGRSESRMVERRISACEPLASRRGSAYSPSERTQTGGHRDNGPAHGHGGGTHRDSSE
jgi:hypothetical protein